MEKKNQILQDHFQSKKKFVTPFNHYFNISDVEWKKEILPELIWLAEINFMLGFRDGTEVSRMFASITKEITNKNSFFGFISSFYAVNDSNINEIIKRLEKEKIYGKLQSSFHDLNLLYPSNPLCFLSNSNDKNYTANMLSNFKSRLQKLFDKGDLESIFMLANAIYIAFTTDGFQVINNSSLANFPKIINYPHTEESKRIAGSIAETINIFIKTKGNKTDWNIQFWNRGFELEDCY